MSCRNFLVLGFCSAAFLLSTGTPLQAAEATIDEITVTALKRAQPLQKVPLSLQVLQDAEIERNRIGGIASLRGRIPGLLAIPHPNADTTLGVFLRGVGNPDEQVIQDPSVGVYVDGIYLPRNQGLGIELAQLDQVEVLKGPQGTLYGRNASGGAINFVTRDPGTAPWRFVQQVAGGNRDFLNLKTQLDWKPFDTLGVSAAYLHSQENGFVANTGTGADHFGSRNREAAALDFLWQPSASWRVRLKLDQQQHADSPAFIDSVPLFPQKKSRATTGHSSVAGLRNNEATSRGAAAIVEYDTGNNSTLRYLVARRRLRDSQYQDYHSGVLRPGPILVTLAAGEQEQQSHELQWVGASNSGKLEYVVGAFLFSENAERDSENRIIAARSARFVYGRDIENQSRSVFSHLSWKTPLLADRIRVVLGGRYTDDQRDAVLKRANGNLVTGAITNNPQPNIGSRRFSDFSPAAGLVFDASDDLTTYLRYEQGYKSGGFNARASTAERFAQGFDDEELGSWELGIKAQLPAMHSRLQAALFDTTYDRIQLEVRSNPLDFTVSDVLNAGEASLRGIELELESVVFSQLRLALSYTGLLAGNEEVFDAAGRNVADNYRFVGAPRHAAHAGLEFDFGLEGSGDLTARLDWAWQDDFYSSSTLAGGRYRIAAYGLVDLSLHYTRNLQYGQVTLGLWARNVADKEYYLGHFNGGTGAVVPSAIWGSPRSSGIDFVFRL